MAFELLQTQPKPPANKPRERKVFREAGVCGAPGGRPVLRPRGSHSVPDSRTQNRLSCGSPPGGRAARGRGASPRGHRRAAPWSPDPARDFPQEDAGAAGEAQSPSPPVGPAPPGAAAEPRTPRSAPEGPVLGLGARAPCGAAPGRRVRRSGRWAPPGGGGGGGSTGVQGAAPEPGGRQRPAAAAAPPPAWFLRVRRSGPRQLAPPPRAPLTSHGTGRPGSRSCRARTSPEGSISLRLGPWGSPLWGRLRQREPGLGVRAGGPRAGPREGLHLPEALGSRRGKAEPPTPGPRPPHAPPFPVRSAEGAAGRAGRGLPPGVPRPRFPGRSRGAPLPGHLPPRPPDPPPGTGTVARGRAPGFAATHSPRRGPTRRPGAGVRATAAQACAGRTATGRGAPAAAELGARSARAARRAQRRRQVPARGSGRAAPARRPHGRARNAEQRAKPSWDPACPRPGVRPLRVPPERGGGGRGARRLLPPAGTGAFSGRAPGPRQARGGGRRGRRCPLRSGEAGHRAEGAALAGVPVGLPPPPPPPPPPPRAFPAAAAASPPAGGPRGSGGSTSTSRSTSGRAPGSPRTRPSGRRSTPRGSTEARGGGASTPRAEPTGVRIAVPRACPARVRSPPGAGAGPEPRALEAGGLGRPGRPRRPRAPRSLAPRGFPGPCPCLVAAGPGCPQQLPRAGQGGRRPQRA
ncbi:unnamed protein product [Nyctereutes procyonoides]|uniref:(raccoon dog) hypothetical protein n=1 Tax=Nyctereutes procyonoides TaxID=34880 RepID=A0A811ZPN1_NYCPR|nr:unnamed protein product [Nyctereutes procyonoides]